MTRIERRLKLAVNPWMTRGMRRFAIRGRDEVVGAVARARFQLDADRLAPRALIIGAQKAGTTFLHHQLELHPQIRGPLTKELHFFDDRFSRGLGWYLGHFPKVGDPAEIAIESSPGYLFHPHAIGRIDRLLPGSKVIILLRDPTMRAYSHFLHERRLGYEPEADFARALDLESRRVDGELRRMAEDPNYVSFAARHYSYVRRGEYLSQVQRCHETVGPQRVLVIRNGELFQHPRSALERVTTFLGLPPWQPVVLAPNDMQHPGDPPIEEVTRRRLDEHFAPLQRELESYLERVYGRV